MGDAIGRGIATSSEAISKKLTGTDQIWEIRAQVGSDIFRVLGFFGEDNNFVATNGLYKKTMALPKIDIHLAEKRKKDYLVKNTGSKP